MRARCTRRALSPAISAVAARVAQARVMLRHAVGQLRRWRACDPAAGVGRLAALLAARRPHWLAFYAGEIRALWARYRADLALLHAQRRRLRQALAPTQASPLVCASSAAA